MFGQLSTNDRKKKQLGSSIQCQIKTSNFARGTHNFPECGDLYHPDSDMGHASHHYSHSYRSINMTYALPQKFFNVSHRGVATNFKGRGGIISTFFQA